MRTAEEIAHLFHQRQAARGGAVAKMEQVRRTYNGDLVIPLPEIDEAEKSGVVNLVMQGVDQLAMRVASVSPDIVYPPLRPGIQRSEDAARDRRLANLGWWDMNTMPIVLRQRARFLIAYGTTPVTVLPASPKINDQRSIPFWRPRNPLSAYLPEPEVENDMEPADAIFCHTQSRGWLEQRYPEIMARLSRGDGADPTDRFDTLEYMDAEEMVLVVLGKETHPEPVRYGAAPPPAQGTMSEVLARAPNRAEVPLVVCPGRIVLDKMIGMFDQLPDLMWKQGKLDALEYVSIRRAAFGDEWVITHPSSMANAVVVTEATGVKGIRGEIQGGQVQTVNSNPSPLVAQALDRMERNQRVTAGLPSELGGESPTNVRTARRGAAVMSATLTMPIGEMQDLVAASLEAENVRGVAVMKAYHKGKSFAFTQTRFGKGPDRNDYDVTATFETDWHVVKYSIPGTDAAAIPIEIGQRLGTGEMSLQTAREMDPVIEDPIRERDQVEVEGLRRAMLQGLEQQAQQGALSPVTIALIAKQKLSSAHPALEDAVIAADAEMKKNQAQQTPQPTAQPQGQPGMGGGTPAGTPVPPAPAGQLNLATMLQTLRRPANQGPAERQLTAAGPPAVS